MSSEKSPAMPAKGQAHVNCMKFPYHRKPYSDSTLMSMTKKELVEIIRDYEHNYSVLYEQWENTVRAAEKAISEAKQ